MNKVIDTEDQDNQIITECQKNNMLIPIKSNKLILLNTSLIISKPRFIKKFRNSKYLKLATIYTFSLLIVAFSFVQIGRLCNQKNTTEELTKKIHGYIVENSTNGNEKNVLDKYAVDFNGLKSINPDTKAWIKVNGIGLDIPVVQGEDNSYYLKHSFDKSYNVCGWAFADYRNRLDGTDKNIVIFGHNRKDGNMFSKMTEILEQEWYDEAENKNVTFITEGGETTYEVFSIYQIEVEDYYIKTNFRTDEEYQDFLNLIKSRSTKDYNMNLTAKDKILTLSTCGKDNKHRIVLHAKEL
ncbi:MAG: class B sortase [Clostridia bacterium]|nr:class B sortase [Clostridia bacterium]